MNHDLTTKISNFIRDKRLALGMSQRELAIHIFGDERKRQWINKIEHGSPIRVTTLGVILDKLNADVDIIEY